MAPFSAVVLCAPPVVVSVTAAVTVTSVTETSSVSSRKQIVLTLGFVGVGNDTDLLFSHLIWLRAGLRWGCGLFLVQCFI